jgi:hypothetical protein
MIEGMTEKIGVSLRQELDDRAAADVALAVAERGHAVLTSADADIAGVSPALVLAHV